MINRIRFIALPIVFALFTASCTTYDNTHAPGRSGQTAPVYKAPQDETAFSAVFSDYERLPSDFAALLNYPALPLFSHNGPSELTTIKSILDTHFRYMSDLRQYGENIIWQSPMAMRRDGAIFVGDLEDYAILARAMLHHRKIPARIAMLSTLYDGQMVMVTEANGLVIDRLQKDIRPQKYYQFQMLSQISLNKPWRIF